MTGQVPFAFADDKDPQAFRTIGEVANAFGIKQHVLRYWEEQFPMLKPLKRSSKLTKQEFAEYVDYCIRKGAEHGIYVPPPEEFT